MWRHYDAWGNPLEPQGPRSPGAPPAPGPENHRHMNFNFFHPDDFSIKNLAPTNAVVKDGGEKHYRGQVTSLRTVGTVASRPKSPTEPPLQTANARFVPNVESDIYAVSSDED